jgi:hypothetical protein
LPAITHHKFSAVLQERLCMVSVNGNYYGCVLSSERRLQTNTLLPTGFLENISLTRIYISKERTLDISLKPGANGIQRSPKKDTI